MKLEDRKERSFHEKTEFKPTHPIMEVVNIRATARRIKLKKPFVYLKRVIMSLKWDALANDWDLFAGATALTNGIQFDYDKEPVFDVTLKNNFDIVKYDYDYNIDTDGAGTKNTVFASRLSFDRFSPKGYDLTGNKIFEVVIQDNMSLIGDELVFTFEGFKWRK